MLTDTGEYCNPLQALCPGVRRTFTLDMTAAGRRDGKLVKAEAAVESVGEGAMEAPIFISKHPRWYGSGVA